MMVARGIPTGFTVGLEQAIPESNLAHVVALKTRVIDAGEAVRQVLAAAEMLIAAGARQIFFKYCATFDSTPAGNIGPCAEALMDRLGARLVLFCPALCETGRTVFQGHMFGGAQLLGESPKRFDPLTPMTDSNLVRVLQAQSTRPVGLLSHAFVDGGAETIAARCEELAEAGTPLVIADTIYERDLAALARASAGMPLLTGNSSVAAHLPPLWREAGLVDPAAAVETLPGIDGPAAVLAGSVAPRTAEQLERFGKEHPVLILDLSRAFAGHDLVGEALGWAQRNLAAGQAVAIATTVPQKEVEALQSAYGRSLVAEKAERIIAALAQSLTSDLGVRRLIVAGGETAGAVVAALPVERMIVGPYEGPGVSRMVAHMPHPVALMLKSGKLGGPDIFADVLEAMRHPIDAVPLDATWPPRRAES